MFIGPRLGMADPDADFAQGNESGEDSGLIATLELKGGISKVADPNVLI
jgi:hypothetical protein